MKSRLPPGSDVLIRADPSVLQLDEVREIAGVKIPLIAVQISVHDGKLFAEHQHFLRCQRLQTDNRRQQISGSRL